MRMETKADPSSKTPRDDVIPSIARDLPFLTLISNTLQLNVACERSFTMHSTSRLLVPAVMTLFFGVICVAALAQMPTYKVGKTLSAEELRSWDTGIGPEGKEQIGRAHV